MNDYIVAIPSYMRPERQETLYYFRSLGFPKERIFIFVQTDDDFERYSRNHGDECNILYYDADSVSMARNNILRYFDKKQNILMMDDDVSSILIMENKTLYGIETLEELESVIGRMFGNTKKTGAYLCGMYPVKNEYFMSDTVSTCVTVNTVIGFPKGFPYLFDERFIAKEDIELCGRVLDRGGSIIRFNNLTFKAKHRTNKGGTYEIWHSNANEKYSRMLCAMYPSVFAQQKNKPQEVRVKLPDKKKRGVAWRTK